MTDSYELKYRELFTEFSLYILENDGFAAQIPRNALVVLLDKSDPAFSQRNIALAREYLKNDDMPDRPVVYIEVGKLAPVRSRLQNPRIVTELPDYTVV
jgi:hypothetical protein